MSDVRDTSSWRLAMASLAMLCACKSEAPLAEREERPKPEMAPSEPVAATDARTVPDGDPGAEPSSANPLAEFEAPGLPRLSQPGAWEYVETAEDCNAFDAWLRYDLSRVSEYAIRL